MPESHAILREFFARHPSSIASSGLGGQYRIVCAGCGEVLAVTIPAPEPPALDIACERCGWAEHYGAPQAHGRLELRAAGAGPAAPQPR